MAFIDKTMFEIKVSNSVRNQIQNVPGKYGTGTGSSFTESDCSAGALCVQNGLIPVTGYENIVDANGNARIVNGNTWYFNAATNGNSGGMVGDHTGIYASNTYNVQSVSVNGQIYHIGNRTLGLGIPAGEFGDFTELIVGEQYAFGIGNFSTAPTDSTYKYATISNGLLVASTTAPAAGSGVYFEILRTAPVNEGTTYWGSEYVLKVMRAAAATA